MEELSISDASQQLEKVADWSLEDNGKAIAKNFEFPGFKEAMDFVNKIAMIAEQQGHHPEIKLYDYNKVQVKASTHSAQGLTEKDFKLASEIDKI